MTEVSAPASDEIEITLLGRGSGESVVMHVGDGEWVVIDSLSDKDRDSAPRAYLEGLGVAQGAVKLVLATHWHDDHIGGFAKLCEWASTANIAMSIAKTGLEMVQYIEAQGPQAVGSVSSGADELAAVIRLAIKSSRTAKPCFADKVLLRREHASTGIEIVLHALSPADADVNDFLLKLADQKISTDIAFRLRSFEPNDISVATWLTIGADAVLLGADLENKNKADRGWRAVVASDTRPRGAASLVKLAHHGAESGDHDGIWADMSVPDPIVMLTPYNKGTGVPSKNDKKRILNRTQNAYVTNISPFRKSKNANQFVQSALSANSIKLNVGNRNVGRVTMRKKIGSGGAWSVSCENGAANFIHFVTRDD